MLIGFRTFPIINLTYSLDRRIWGNSLAIEPSHAARILTVAFLSLLRMYEIKWGSEAVSISKLFYNSKWIVIGFLWSMMTMGSGTAFIGLGILSLYFIKRQYILTIIPLIIIFYFTIPYIDYEPLQRGRRAVDATLTWDQNTIRETDGSAAARVLPLVNTIKKLDLIDLGTWLGGGIDQNKSIKHLSDDKIITSIQDYGLLSYIISLIFIFSCCIRKFISLETLIFFLLLGAGLSNVAYIWGILMIFSVCRYFKEQEDVHYAE